MGWNKAEFTRLKALITEITEAASREEDPNGFMRLGPLAQLTLGTSSERQLYALDMRQKRLGWLIKDPRSA